MAAAAFAVLRPAGTYFVVADAAPLGGAHGLALCRDLPRRVGVAAVPVSVFHDDPLAAPSLVRLAFFKRDEVLAEAVTRLGRVAGSS